MLRKDLTVGQLYYVNSIDLYVLTPDNVGAFWFDSFAQAFDETGLDDVVTIGTLED